jgi:hypothetical protein
VILGAAALALGVSGFTGVSGALAGNGNDGETGHTPVVVCHWVPAAPSGAHNIAGPDGGSYNVIVVDDDGADGNKKLRAHAHHENDVIAPVDGECDRVIDED